ncbi:MAG: hypothetical protein EA364_00655 [Balneolaceae bacterium]|nr:MAG: hypothetical protein EA364_00655 [Balneolaceae bacterium]
MLHKILSAFAILTLTLSGHIFAQVVYNDDIQPIFNTRCIACHGGTSGVFLTSYQAVMGSVGQQYGTNIVIPNEPDQSPIIDKIGTSPTYGDRMPQGGPYLSEDQGPKRCACQYWKTRSPAITSCVSALKVTNCLVLSAAVTMILATEW